MFGELKVFWELEQKVAMFREARGNAELSEFEGKQILEDPGKRRYNI